MCQSEMANAKPPRKRRAETARPAITSRWRAGLIASNRSSKSSWTLRNAYRAFIDLLSRGGRSAARRPDVESLMPLPHGIGVAALELWMELDREVRDERSADQILQTRRRRRAEGGR